MQRLLNIFKKITGRVKYQTEAIPDVGLKNESKPYAKWSEGSVDLFTDVMNVVDFSRSFLSTVTSIRHGYVSRFQIESVCTIMDNNSGTRKEYCYAASCKGEDTFGKKDLFYRENYDFGGIYSDEEYVIFRTYALHTDGFREEGIWKNTFDDVRFHLIRIPGKALKNNDEIIQATNDQSLLVGNIAWNDENRGCRVVLEFPIKIMNVHSQKSKYQVDTGPIAFPDLRIKTERYIECMSPAFVAFNAPDFADFVIQQPYTTRQGDVEFQVTHYSGHVSLKARTGVYAI